ncbi:MAG: DUF4836 family protein [Phaeodactylibacter sp.]|nr:DUF4836 family protein [Phaeodactylibacter sp.]
MKETVLKIALFGAIVLGITFTACKTDGIGSGGQDALQTIPDDASGIVAVNLPSILEKMDYENYRNTDGFKKRVAEAKQQDPLYGAILEDPEAAGIALNQKAYLSIGFAENSANEDFSAFVVSLSDADKFEATVQAQSGKTIKAQDGFKSIQLDRQTTLGWNDEYVIIANSSSYVNMDENLARFFNMEKGSSIAQNKNLSKALSKEHDINTWLTSNPIAGNPQAGMAMAMAEVDPEALKDNFVHGYVDFLDGQIKGEADLEIQKALSKDLDLLFKDEAKTDFSPYISNEGLQFLMVNSLDIKGIHELLSARPNSKGFLDFALREYGLTIQDIADTFGGDVMVASYDSDGRLGAAGVFATDIKDEKKLSDFLNLAVEKKMLETEGDNTYKIIAMRYSGQNGGFDVNFEDGMPRLLIHDGKLFITGNQTFLDKIAGGGFSKSERVSNDKMKLVKNNILTALFTATPESLKNFGPTDLDGLKVEDVIFQANRKKLLFDMQLENKKENALKQMVETE